MIVDRTFNDELESYLISSGWSQPEMEGELGGIWRLGDEWKIPIPRNLSPDSIDWEIILDRLSRATGMPVELIEQRVANPAVDVLNLRAANDYAIRDTISYKAGSKLVSEAWRMFRSAATTSFRGRAAIRGNYSRQADAIAEKARMAHTRRGSYVIPLYMPLSLNNDNSNTLLAENEAPDEPAERRVTRTFAEALHSIESNVLEPATAPDSNAIKNLVLAGVSLEFTSALARIAGDKDINVFSASFEWSNLGGRPPTQSTGVDIPSAAAPLIEETGRKLNRANSNEPIEFLSGPIVGVYRDEDTSGGRVTVSTFRNRPAHVHVNVSSEVLENSLDWMKRRVTVVVEGRIRRVSDGLQCDRLDSVRPLLESQLF